MTIEIKDSLDKMRKEVRKQTMTYVAGGLSLVAGLAWNDAIKSTIEFFLPTSGNSIVVKFIYAAVITLVVVLVLSYLQWFLKAEKDVIE